MVTVTINEIEPHVAMRQFREERGVRLYTLSRKLKTPSLREIETGCIRNPKAATRDRLCQFYPQAIIDQLRPGSSTHRLRSLKNDERFQRLRSRVRAMVSAVHPDRYKGASVPVETVREWVGELWRLLDRR